MRFKLKSLRILILLLMLCSTLMAKAQNSKEYPTIPFETNVMQPNDIVVHVLISGHDYRFLVDTGDNSYVTLFPWAAKELHLDDPKSGTQTTKIELSTGDGVTVQNAAYVRLPNITLVGKTPDENLEIELIGKVRLLDIQLYLKDDPRFAGIIGFSLLKKVPFQIDYARQELRIFVSGQLDPTAVQDTQPIPFSERNSLIFVNGLATKGEEALPMLLDTGAVHTEVPPEMLTKTGTIHGLMDTERRADGITRKTLRFCLPTLLLPGLIEKDVITCIGRPKSDPILGSDLLSRFVITMDYPHKHLYFQRAVDYDERSRIPGLFPLGVERKAKNKPLVIKAVPFGTTAANHGIQSGDVITKINGTPTSAISEGALLRGKVGDKLELTIVRGKTERTVTLSLIDGYRLVEEEGRKKKPVPARVKSVIQKS